MATYEVELLYDEYCMDCYAEGITPKSMVQWWEEMEQRGKQNEICRYFQKK